MKKKQKELAKEHKTKEEIYKRKGLIYYLMPALTLTVLSLCLMFAWHIDLTFGKITLKLVIFIACCALGVLYYINVIRFIVLLFCCESYHAYVLSTMSDYVRMKQGCSGTGKSSSGSHEAKYMADECKRLLMSEYWRLSNTRSRTDSEERDYQEVKKAYEFYTAKDYALQAEAERNIAERRQKLKDMLLLIKAMSKGKAKRKAKADYRRQRALAKRADRNEIVGCVWCLWSNIPIRVGNRMSCTATVRHLLQLDILPKYTVLIWDEIGNTLSKQGFTQKRITQFIEELFRYPRHYNEMRIIMTEQEGSNVLIAARKNIAFMDFFTQSQKSLMKPLLFKLIKKFIDWYIEKRDYKPKARWLVRLYNYAFDMYKNIGFRAFTVMRLGNQEQAGAGQVINKEKRRIAPASLNCEYDSRCYREGYKPKDKVINGVVWEKLTLSKQDISTERELRENLLSKPTIELLDELGLKLSPFDQITLAIEGTDIDYNKVNEWIRKKYKKKTPINKLTSVQVEEILRAIASYKAKKEAEEKPAPKT